MLTLDPKELPIPKLHHYLLGSIGPRPIAFASTVDAEGNRNLAPFSFFNVFSANPPILIFSPARSGRTNTTKNTHDNVKEVAEVVINVVNYDMVHQMSLASSPFEAGVDEFVKAGFTPIASDTIRPFRVKESPVQIECKVIEVKELGENGGAGNLVICEVQKIHIDERVLDENQMVDQQKIDLVSRMGGNWYCRANDASMFEVDKPITTIGIGVDSLPMKIRTSSHLTGNDLGILGNMESIPTVEEIKRDLSVMDTPSFSLAKELLSENKPQRAYAVLTQVL
jgi:flavin reductase (DIM6/NTAB) family NADH-FMN oxidoreductase RutF